MNAFLNNKWAFLGAGVLVGVMLSRTLRRLPVIGSLPQY